MPCSTRVSPERGDSPPSRAQSPCSAAVRSGSSPTKTKRNHCENRALARLQQVCGGVCVAHSADDYRRNAEECFRLSAGLRDSAHKSFALFLANAWLELAQQAERSPDPAPPGEPVSDGRRESATD
jgi:hypothetical protein